MCASRAFGWSVLREISQCAVCTIRLDEHRPVTATEERPPDFVFYLKTPRVGVLEPLHTVLGCLDAAGMGKLRKGNAPTIRKGPYAGEIVTGDHIIPRSVCPELDNKLYNLEFMPLTLN
jgi:hypothetical protein